MVIKNNLYKIVLIVILICMSSYSVLANPTIPDRIEIDFTLANVPLEMQAAFEEAVLQQPSNLRQFNRLTVVSLDVYEGGDWAIATLAKTPETEAELDAVGMGNTATMVLLHKVKNGWKAGLYGSVEFTQLLGNAPISPSLHTMAATPSFKFPWEKSQQWTLRQGWHDGNYLDFAYAGSDPWILAAESGKVTQICSVGAATANVTIEHSDGTTTSYVHIDRLTLAKAPDGKPLLNATIPQGYRLGQAYAGSYGAGWYKLQGQGYITCAQGSPGCNYFKFMDSCGRGTGTHVHFGLPSRNTIIDGWSTTDSSGQNWRKDTLTKKLWNTFPSTNSSTPQDANFYLYYSPQGTQGTDLAGYDYWNIPAGNNILFIAGVDINGDQVDEVAVMRNENGDYNFYVYTAPGCAESATLLSVDYWEIPAGNNAVAMTGGDFDGDGIDEIAVMKNDNGDYNLYVYDIPLGTAPGSLVIADFWNAPADNNTLAIVGIDIDNDGIDELGVLKNDAGDRNFYIYKLPISGVGAGSLVATDLWNIPDNAIAIAGGNFDNNSPGQEIAVLKNEAGDYNLYIYDTITGTQAAPLLGVDYWNIPSGNNATSIAGINVLYGNTTMVGILKLDTEPPFLPPCYQPSIPLDPNYYQYYAPQGFQHTELAGYDYWNIPAGTPLFIAGVDINGDHNDEIAVMRNDNGDYNFFVYAPPDCGQPATLLSSDYWEIPGGNNAVAMTGGDFDGDGIDEIAVMKNDNGDYNLHVYDIPVGTGSGTLVIADFWNVPSGNNTISMAGVDVDGDGRDEIGVLKNENGDYNFYIYRLPASGTGAGILMAADYWNIPDNTLSIAGGNFDISNPGEEIATLKNENGDYNLYIYSLISGTQAAIVLGGDYWNIPSGNNTVNIAAIDVNGISQIGALKMDTGSPFLPPCHNTMPQFNLIINNQAYYASGSHVTLTLTAPPTFTEVLLSNNATFTNTTWQALTTNVNWELPANDGLYQVYAKFRAGQTESPVVANSIVVDTMYPDAAVLSLPAQVSTRDFVVTWGGYDANGALYAFDIQVKEGNNGIWRDWITNTRTISSTFTGINGKTYYFRARARDEAGNLQPYPEEANTWTAISGTSIFLPLVLRK